MWVIDNLNVDGEELGDGRRTIDAEKAQGEKDRRREG